jgi:hypothetical protein
LRFAWLASLGILVASTIGAQEARDPHTVQPERPTVATHAGTVAPGWLEIETGLERDRFSPGLTTGFTPTILKFGLASHVQLGVFGSVVHNSDATGLGDAGVGVKWRVLDDAPLLGDFAVLPSVKLPSGAANKGTGTGTTDASILLISSHSFGAVSMDLNAGYTRRSGDGLDVPVSATVWTASFGGPLLGAVGWTAECYGYPRTSGPAGQASIVALLAGPTLLFRKWLALDAGVIVPLTGPQPHALYAGAVYNVGHL